MSVNIFSTSPTHRTQPAYSVSALLAVVLLLKFPLSVFDLSDLHIRIRYSFEFDFNIMVTLLSLLNTKKQPPFSAIAFSNSY